MVRSVAMRVAVMGMGRLGATVHDAMAAHPALTPLAWRRGEPVPFSSAVDAYWLCVSDGPSLAAATLHHQLSLS